ALLNELARVPRFFTCFAYALKIIYEAVLKIDLPPCFVVAGSSDCYISPWELLLVIRIARLRISYPLHARADHVAKSRVVYRDVELLHCLLHEVGGADRDVCVARIIAYDPTTAGIDHTRAKPDLRTLHNR